MDIGSHLRALDGRSRGQLPCEVRWADYDDERLGEADAALRGR